MKKSTYFWIGIFSLWFVVIGGGLGSGSLGVLFGEFIGAFGLIYACVWGASKVKRKSGN